MNSRILPTLALMVSVGIFFVYVNSTWTGPIAATKAAMQSDEQALAAAKDYAAQEQELTDARDQIPAADLARLLVFLPDSVDNVRLILDLNALAAKSGVAISNIDVSKKPASSEATNTGISGIPVTNTNVVDSVDMSLSAVGTYSALKTFLSGIEKSERLLDVKDISIKGSDTGVYTYQVKLGIYWLR